MCIAQMLCIQFLSISCKDPYELCSHIEKEIRRLEGQLQHLTTSAELFRLSPPSGLKIEMCRKEIELVKVHTNTFANIYLLILNSSAATMGFCVQH